MQLEDYFEFDDCDRIRVKGTRIAIEYILDPYFEGISPEEILHKYYPNLTLEQVYATITYYLHNRAEVGAYIERNEAADEAFHREYQQREPSEVVKRLLAHRAQQDKSDGKSQ